MDYLLSYLLLPLFSGRCFSLKNIASNDNSSDDHEVANVSAHHIVTYISLARYINLRVIMPVFYSG